MPHIHDEPGQYDFTSEVLIVHKNKVLLRKHDKYHIWLGVGGHTELDEDPIESAKREVMEEVGLEIEIYNPNKLPPNGLNDIELIPPIHLNKHSINEDHSHIALIYYAKSNTFDVKPENPTDEWEWLTKEDLESDKLELHANIRYYALEALQLLSS